MQPCNVRKHSPESRNPAKLLCCWVDLDVDTVHSTSGNMISLKGARSRRGATISILLVLGLVQLHGGSSFLLSGSTATTRSRRASRCLRTTAWAQDAGEAEAKEVQTGPTSPSGLALEGVYKRLKLETQGLADGVVGLESKDTDFGVSLETEIFNRGYREHEAGCVYGKRTRSRKSASQTSIAHRLFWNI